MSLLAGLSQQGDSISAHNSDAAAHARQIPMSGWQSATSGSGSVTSTVQFLRLDTGGTANSTAWLKYRSTAGGPVSLQCCVDGRVIDFDRGLSVAVTVSPWQFAANQVFTIFVGADHSTTGTYAEPASKGVGIRVYGNGDVKPFTHNGTALVEGSKIVTVTANNDIRIRMLWIPASGLSVSVNGGTPAVLSSTLSGKTSTNYSTISVGLTNGSSASAASLYVLDLRVQ